MTCGVYYIENKVNGNVYIGSSARIEERRSVHFRLLRRGSHFNPYLQSAFDLYGEDNFVFKVMSICPKPLLKDIEQLYIDANTGKYYNLCSVAKDTTGRPCKEETRRKISEANKGKRAGSKNHMFGKKKPQDVIEKIRETSKKRDISYLHTKEVIEKQKATMRKKLEDDPMYFKRTRGGKNHPLWNKKRPKEFCKKLSEAKKGIGGKRVYEVDDHGNVIREFKTHVEAREFYGMTNRNAIYNILRGIKTKGFTPKLVSNI